MPVNYEESVLRKAGNVCNCNVTVTMSSIPIIIEHVENPNGVIEEVFGSVSFISEGLGYWSY